MEILTGNFSETQQLGQSLGALLQPGDVLLVSGDLGAGKTTFIQGLAAGMGVQAQVTSPTFTIIHEYQGSSFPLYHIDAYRLERADEINELGLEEYFYGDGVTAVEWAEKIKEWLPPDYLYVKIEKMSSHPEQRRIQIGERGSGSYAGLIEELKQICRS